MKMYQRDKILNVSSESAWQALKEMNKWLPDLSTNSGISYSMDTDFFEIGRKYDCGNTRRAQTIEIYTYMQSFRLRG